MIKPKRHINLQLPKSYNRCSLEQLRGISSILIEMCAKASRLNPFNMDDFKIAVFFFLAGIEVVEPVNAQGAPEEQFFMARFKTGRIKRCANALRGLNEPFPIYLWQIRGWLDKSKDSRGREVPGMLDWLENDASNPFVSLPMPFVKRRRRGVRGMFGKRCFKGPAPMLDGFSWQRYRYAQDYMEFYVQQQNNLIALHEMGRKISAKDLSTAMHALDTAKAMFLANLFDAKIKHADESTAQPRRDWKYVPDQAVANMAYFRDFPDTDWQIVLLWWSGIMAWLARTYPKVFKKQSTKGAKPVNPMELYARTTATMEKYIGLNADEVNREPYTVILQQMEDIARHNEEMERINKR